MKLTFLLLTVAFLNVSAEVFSQHVTFSGTNVPLEDVFKEIRKQTGYRIIYGNNTLNGTKPVTINSTDTPLADFLKLLLKDQPLTSAIESKTIIVSRRLLLDIVQAFFPVHGRIVDDQGRPLAGASIAVKGGKTAMTDANGSFTVDANTGDILVVTFVGYEPVQVRLNSSSTATILNTEAVKLEAGPGGFSIALQRSTSKLDEVQIIAYGEITRRLQTGSVSTVKAEDIAKQPVTNPLLALQGRVPGLIITQQSGLSGATMNIRIRGQNSIENGNDPLYVIDGVPYTSTLLYGLAGNVLGGTSNGRASNTYSGNPFNFINPADIASIDVLKDADATAIYGSRGANGVILITTKKGIPGKMKVNLNAYAGIGKAPRIAKLMNTQQYVQMRKEALANDGLTPDMDNAYDLLLWDTTRYTDWHKVFLGNTAQYTNAQLSFSGGSSNLQYRIGTGFSRTTSVFPGDSRDLKGSLQFNINSTSSDQKFKINLSGTYLADDNRLPYVSLANSIDLAPNAPKLYNDDGSLNWENNTWENPAAMLKQSYQNRAYNLTGNLNLSYRLLDGLELKASLGYTNMQVNEMVLNPLSSFPPSWGATSGNSSFTNNNIRSYIIEPQATYEIAIGNGKLSALVGVTIQQNTSQGLANYADGFSSDALLKNLEAASSIYTSSTSNKYRYNAIFGRLNYNWQEKYLLNVTARRDGSSRFGPGKQFGNFGAIGGAWIFSAEDFMKSALPALSFGKLRASFGTPGNDQIADYQFLDLYDPVYYLYAGSRGLLPTSLYNPDLAWETNEKLEFGIDLGWFRDRVLLNVNFFRNRSSNQLLNLSLPSMTGFNNIPVNMSALVQNKGWEFLLNTTNVSEKRFTWSSSFNLTWMRNKLLAFPGLETSGYRNNFVIGRSVRIMKAFTMTGVDPQTGVYTFTDKNGHPTAQPSYLLDRTSLQDRDPLFSGGLQNTFRYKDLQLDLLFDFIKQNRIRYLFMEGQHPGLLGYNFPVEIMENIWRKPGDVALYQQLTTRWYGPVAQAYDYANGSVFNITDASFIALRNVALSYRIPVKEHSKLRQCRVYAQGQNLFRIHRYTGDPETVSAVPPIRVITIGIDIEI